MTWTFRDAMAQDVPALVALINRAFRVEDFFKFTDRTSEKDLAQHIERGRVIIAEHSGGKLAGSVYFEIREGKGYFGMLSTAPDLQGRGLGRALVQEAEAAGRAAGCDEMTLSVVNLREELIPWYERLGYVQFALAPWLEHEPSRVPVHFILMSRSLRAATLTTNREALS